MSAFRVRTAHTARARPISAARRCTAIFLLVLSSAAARAEPIRIEPGRTIQAALEGSETLELELSLDPGSAYFLEVRQLGIDVVVEVADPQREARQRIDAPGERNAVERFLLEPGDVSLVNATIAPRWPVAPRGDVAVTLVPLDARAETDSPAFALARAFTQIGLRYAASDMEGALSAAGQALAIARAIGDAEAEATALFAAGCLTMELNRPEDAIATFVEAAARWEALGNVEMQGATENELGLAQALVHQFGPAREHTQRAADLQSSLPWLFDAAQSRNNLCWILVEDGRLEEAAACFEKRLPEVRATNDLGLLASTYNNLAGARVGLGDTLSALSSLESALPLRERIGDPMGIGEVRNNLAFSYRRVGEIQRALDEFAAAIPYRISAGDTRGLAVTYNNMGFLLNLTGDPGGARTYLVAALSLARDAQDRKDEGLIDLNLGNAFNALGSPAEAMLHHENALGIFRQIGDSQGECRALTLLAGDRRRAGAVAAATSYIETALAACASRTDLTARAQLRVEHGRVQALADAPDARTTIESGLALFESMHDPVGSASAHEGLAELAQRRGDLVLALEEAHRAIDELESLRTSIAATDQLARFTSVQQATYDRAIALHLRRYTLDPAERDDLRALELVAAVRARTLAERLEVPGSAAGATQLQQPAPLAEARRRASQLANAYYAALQKGEQKDIDAKELAWRQQRSQFERVERTYFPTPRAAPTTQTILGDLQASLDDDAIVLVYWLGADAGHLWGVTRSDVRSAPLPARDAIDALARGVYASARNSSRGSKDDGHDRTALSHILFDAIPDLDRFTDLYVSADGVLNYVPFAALSPPSSDSALLLERHRIASLPALVRPPSAPRPEAAQARAIIFADPVYGSHDARLSTELATTDPPGEEPASRLRSDLLMLPRLTRSRAEADAVQRMLGAGRSETLLDFAATRERLLDLDDPEANILLIAAHARVRSDSNAGSGIVLSLFDAQGTPQPGFVSYYDLLQIRRAPPLVVLDGCDTGLGVDISGEGPVGIARAFMYAGALQVISSLWPVGDRSSELLMSSFYRGLLTEGRAPAQALQQAQIELRASDQRFRPPRAWAGFTVAYRWPAKPAQSAASSAHVAGSRHPSGS
jgi:CHAT domain-containing protein